MYTVPTILTHCSTMHLYYVLLSFPFFFPHILYSIETFFHTVVFHHLFSQRFLFTYFWQNLENLYVCQKKKLAPRMMSQRGEAAGYCSSTYQVAGPDFCWYDNTRCLYSILFPMWCRRGNSHATWMHYVNVLYKLGVHVGHLTAAIW